MFVKQKYSRALFRSPRKHEVVGQNLSHLTGRSWCAGINMPKKPALGLAVGSEAGCEVSELREEMRPGEEKARGDETRRREDARR
eukprot:747805-Hanusia_phi.AAC.2